MKFESYCYWEIDLKQIIIIIIIIITIVIIINAKNTEI